MKLVFCPHRALEASVHKYWLELASFVAPYTLTYRLTSSFVLQSIAPTHDFRRPLNRQKFQKSESDHATLPGNAGSKALHTATSSYEHTAENPPAVVLVLGCAVGACEVDICARDVREDGQIEENGMDECGLEIVEGEDG
jgi:hypothetical protein